LIWQKKGLIFKPDDKIRWMKTHAALPFGDKIRDNLYRIFFSVRDSKNKAHTASLDIDIKDPSRILRISKKAILSPGKKGTFDENGVMASCMVNHANKKYLYYTGWSSSKTVPFIWSIGLAISKDKGKTFQKYSDGPIISRNVIDPFFVGSPTVINENKIWKMWYVTTDGWVMKNKKLVAPYYLKYAESKNGSDWRLSKNPAIKLNHNEIGLGRASVIKDKGVYRMWYSYAKKNYRIGYAESKNGKKWKRKDHLVGITVSRTGWDSKSIEYPYIFDHKKIRYMLYNGNQYGLSGFGYAVLNPMKKNKN